MTPSPTDSATDDYALSLRQMAKWVREAVVPGSTDPGFDLGDVDTDELDAAAAHIDSLRKENAALLAQCSGMREALEHVAQIQRDKCECADAETLFMILDNKVCVAQSALSTLPARGKDADTFHSKAIQAASKEVRHKQAPLREALKRLLSEGEGW